MIQITPQHHLHIKVEPIDFRKGIDALVGLCRQNITSPYGGAVFAFRNKSSIAVKLLVYDGTGFWLMTKRFSQGKLRYWPKSCDEHVCATTMAVILNQGRPGSMRPAWRALPSSA
ncbi:IS66 family insertion sequence element accessory protein TnpB [Legionella longbeachae]|uniref:IS66 family insertion sequence element accessory protein TnpB n=1 Tax=Legionella longbeachae TaxID=450 RepID=UPI00399C642A